MRKLLAELYRPNTIDGYVFQSEANERKVRKWLKEGEIPNILLTGTQGIGKTTLSRILVNELGIGGTDLLTINASKLKMEHINSQIEPFISKSTFAPFKIIQLEEMDRISQPAQQVLRAIIEDSSDRVRWIGTANYDKKIIPALQSRFQHLHMEEMNYDGILEYVINIIEKEELVINEDEDLLSHIDAYAPDLRKIINSIDEHTDVDKVLHPLETKSTSTDASEFETIFIEGKAKEKLEQLLELTENIDANNFEWFYEVMYTHANENNYDDVANAIILISKYLDRAYTVANQRITLDACLYEIFLVGDEED